MLLMMIVLFKRHFSWQGWQRVHILTLSIVCKVTNDGYVLTYLHQYFNCRMKKFDQNYYPNHVWLNIDI
jgi:hypothetical protein